MTAHAVAFPELREFHLGTEAICRDGEVSPARDEQQRRATDASRLTFPLQLVIVIIGGILATTGAFWVSTSALRSDVRDILTRMSLQSDIDRTNSKLVEERSKMLNDAVSELKRQQQMQYYDLQDLKRDVAVLKAQGVKK